jgi:c-di-GMP-binding flagellar brake protein YcgR
MKMTVSASTPQPGGLRGGPWVKLGPGHIAMNTKSPAFSNKPLPDSELITDTARVARLLDRLAKHHSLLTVVMPGQPEAFTSSVVEVAEPHVLLDELLPNSGHPLLLAQKKIQATGKLDGIDIRFVSELDGFDDEDGMVTYRVRLPARLEYRQRRNDFRAHIPISTVIRVVMIDDRENIFEGELYDLSRGGAGIVLPFDEAVLVPGRWYYCAIELPGSAWLFCDIEQRHWKELHAAGKHLAGTRFAGLTPMQTRLVGRCISELQREQMKRRVTD